MDGSTGSVVGEVAQSEAFHDDTLAGERSIPVELHTHYPVAKFAIIRGCFQMRILFRSRLAKGHGIYSLYP